MSHQKQKRKMLTPDVNSAADEAARNIVFTDAFGTLPRKILLNLNSAHNDCGLVLAAAPTKEQVQQKNVAERAAAAKFGIDGDAYRDSTGRTHNGARPYVKEMQVRVALLVGDLAAAGYKLTGTRLSQKTVAEGEYQPDPAVQLTFTLEGEEMEMTERIKAFLDYACVNKCYVYCNPKMDQDGTPYRMDTINGYVAHFHPDHEDTGRYLRFAPAAGSSGYDIEQ